jgi:hypothetical protein
MNTPTTTGTIDWSMHTGVWLLPAAIGGLRR